MKNKQICKFEESKKPIYKINCYFFQLNLYKEWHIWSKCLGKVLVINGVSSSGKSTVSNYLTKSGFNYIGLDSTRDKLLLGYATKNFESSIFEIRKYLTDDQILKILMGYKIVQVRYPAYEIEFTKTFQKQFFNFIQHDNSFLTRTQIFEEMYEVAKKYIFSGQNVILDIVANTDGINLLRYSFRYYPLKIGLLYNNLEDNLKKCFQRNYLSMKDNLMEFRFPSDILAQYREFYEFVPQENKHKYVIGSVDKYKIANILEIAIYCQYRLIDNLKNYIFDKEIQNLFNTKALYENKIKELHNSVKILKSYFVTMHKIFIVPKIEYDFIVNPNSLVSCTSPIEREKFFLNLNTLFQSDLRNINARLIVYTKNHIPEILGNFGDVIELEYSGTLRILSNIRTNIATTYLSLKEEVFLREVHTNTNLDIYTIDNPYNTHSHTGKFNFIKQLNNYIKHYFKKLLLFDEFKIMQELANKYNVKIQIVDEKTLKHAYHKIALKTHPDKSSDTIEDFIKAKQLMEQKDNPISIEIYNSIINVIQNINIVVKAIDTTIDTIRVLKEPSLENISKVGTGCVYLTSIYTGKTEIIFPIAVAESAYQVYKGSYWDAAILMTKAVGFTLIFSTIHTNAPALSIVLSTGFTVYSTYSMLNNGCELYYELLEDNSFKNTSDEILVGFD